MIIMTFEVRRYWEQVFGLNRHSFLDVSTSLSFPSGLRTFNPSELPSVI